MLLRLQPSGLLVAEHASRLNFPSLPSSKLPGLQLPPLGPTGMQPILWCPALLLVCCTQRRRHLQEPEWTKELESHMKSTPPASPLAVAADCWKRGSLHNAHLLPQVQPKQQLCHMWRIQPARFPPQMVSMRRPFPLWQPQHLPEPLMELLPLLLSLPFSWRSMPLAPLLRPTPTGECSQAPCLPIPSSFQQFFAPVPVCSAPGQVRVGSQLHAVPPLHRALQVADPNALQ
mmetsp:Transcript_57571/g.106376  ORF Transcript_57571/g.106376 Transcript_57571/m.106376 type:complete len:231 (+) Transcript_57571:97-789(+)